MSEYYARSPKIKQGIPAQSYAGHVNGVHEKAERYVVELLSQQHQVPYADWLKNCVGKAAFYHDLGKLDPENQQVLSGRKNSQNLPIRHEDAGAAHCITLGDSTAAMLIYAHHQGLPNRSEERGKGPAMFRVENAAPHTDAHLQLYLQRHGEAGIAEPAFTICDFKAFTKNHTPFRIALSCLVDADHTDAASAEAKDTDIDEYPQLRAKERLASLDRYVQKLTKQAEENDRTALRRKMYTLCRNATPGSPLCYCDSPVGTGKTTAIMAYLLQLAIRHKLRRIFVVLPYTNIIDQSVDVYRKALVLAGEDSQSIVAAHHSRTDFESDMLRDMTTTWRAPIVLTSAVQFFETMAAARPASLRKLHRLPGSAVFLDEAHAALPITLWPLAWRWLKEYAHTLGCHFVLGSGSLYKFWELPEIDEQPDVPPLLPSTFTQHLSAHEEKRITHHHLSKPLTLDTITPWLDTLPGPRLCIVNTVQCAAFIADKIRKEKGRRSVEHLSTALTPKDRAAVLQRVRQRLKDPADNDWTLVATSCVEAGVDLSFACGVRQVASLVNLLQTSGRINRHNEYGSGQMWSIELIGPYMNEHPAFKFSSHILKDFIEADKVKPEFCTLALQRELDESNASLEWNPGLTLSFKYVADNFKVINADTRTVIVDEDVIHALQSYEKISWKTLQESSVQIWANKIEKLRLQPVMRGVADDSLYIWGLGYDDFLGYMKGLLPVIELETSGVAIL